MATQVIRKAIGNSPDAREIELIGGLVRAHGRVTLLVPHAGMRDVCRRTLADAGLGLAVAVETPARSAISFNVAILFSSLCFRNLRILYQIQ